jgi:hypothetical protein
VAVLPDHHDFLICCEGDDINPVLRFNDVEIVFGSRARGDGRIRPDREDPKGLFRLGANAGPWLDHSILLISERVSFYFGSSALSNSID